VRGVKFCWIRLKCDAIFITLLDVTAIATCLATLLQTAITVSHLLSNQVKRAEKKMREQIDQFGQGMLWQKIAAAGLRFCNIPILIPDALMT
jgi:hypothetical protein